MKKQRQKHIRAVEQHQSKQQFAGRRKPGNCNNCGKPGHWARECFSQKRERDVQGRFIPNRENQPQTRAGNPAPNQYRQREPVNNSNGQRPNGYGQRPAGPQYVRGINNEGQEHYIRVLNDDDYGVDGDLDQSLASESTSSANGSGSHGSLPQQRDDETDNHNPQRPGGDDSAEQQSDEDF